MGKVIIPSEDVFDYMIDHGEELRKEMHEIANNDVCGIAVYVTRSDDGDFLISVYEDDEEITCERVFDYETCEEIAQGIYEEYVHKSPFGIFDDEYINDDDRIFERETELFEAASDYLDVICDDRFFKDQIDDVNDIVCRYLTNRHGIKIYRPMLFEDESGEEYIEDYPYEVEDDFFDVDDFEEVEVWEE